MEKNLSQQQSTRPLISSNQRFKAISEHLCSNLNGEAVILSLKNEKYYGLNSVGLSIWSLIQKPVTFSDIQASLMQQYDVDETTCRQEILTFLERMEKEGLIEVSNEKSA